MSEEIRFLPTKNQSSITREWDLIAAARDDQLASDLDQSFSAVLEPWILDHIKHPQSALDIGCGTGRLTSKIQKSGTTIVGLDPSPASIEIARSHASLISFHVASVEEWAERHPDKRFDLIVANMVLMDALHLDEVCRAVARLGEGGRLVATITHPAFWPIYWGYANRPGFDYSNEIIVEAPFRTRSFNFSLNSTHIHRPIAHYLQSFKAQGLHVVNVEELRGPEDVEIFPFPRFLCLEATIGRKQHL